MEAVGGIVGGLLGSSSSSKAAKAQQAAAAQASATQLEMFNTARKDQEPWRNAGQAGLNELAFRLGIMPASGAAVGEPGQGLPNIEAYDAIRNRLMPDFTKRGWVDWGGDAGGEYKDVVDNAALENAIKAELARQQTAYGQAVDAQRQEQALQQAVAQGDPRFGSLLKQFTMADFEKDPGYEFRRAEGEKAVQNSMIARGGALSGAAAKALSRYNQGFASNEFGNAFNRFEANKAGTFNRLASLAGVGQTAAQQIANQGLQTGQSIAQNQIGAGNARASGYVGGANALAGGISQGISAYQNNQFMNRLLGNGGSSTFGAGDFNGFAGDWGLS